jgi:hypothetical protein
MELAIKGVAMGIVVAIVFATCVHTGGDVWVISGCVLLGRAWGAFDRVVDEAKGET